MYKPASTVQVLMTGAVSCSMEKCNVVGVGVGVACNLVQLH